MGRSAACAMALACLAFVGVGCKDGGGEAPGDEVTLEQGPSGSWVGALNGRDAFAAVVSDGNQVIAYVCEDGVLGSWFVGPISGRATQLENPNGARLDLELTGEMAKGLLISGEKAWPFEAAPSEGDNLFRADGVEGTSNAVAGWIRFGDRTQGTVRIDTTLQLPPPLTVDAPVKVGKFILTPEPIRPDTLGRATTNSTRFVWAAAGDSFGSGEGNPIAGIVNPDTPDTFVGLTWANDASLFVPLEGSNLARDSFTCHRSDEAGAPKAQRRLKALYPDVSFVLGFVACSGAETKHLIGTSYSGAGNTEASLRGNPRIVQPPQLDRIADFKQRKQGQLDAMYMSIGGNDMGFGEIIQDCIFPFAKTCVEKWADLLPNRLETLKSNYGALNQALVAKLGQNLPVLISQYPNPMHNGTSRSPPVCVGSDYDAHGDVGIGGWDDILQDNLSAAEAEFAFGIASKLSAQVSSSAEQHGWKAVSSHVAAFEGHGLCTGTPMANLNSHALRRQGRDIQGHPTLGTLQFLFSSGFMHPNETGYVAYGDAISDALRPHVDDRIRTGLVPPMDLRIAAAVNKGPITVRWNDRATSENGYEVEVSPARDQDRAQILIPTGAVALPNGGFITRVLGANKQEFVHVPAGPGQFRYKVRACNFGISSGDTCGVSSATLGVNTLPRVPENLELTTVEIVFQGEVRRGDTKFRWQSQDDTIQYVARIERKDGSGTPTELRTNTTSVNAPSPASDFTFRVAACNRVGCSHFATAEQ